MVGDKLRDGVFIGSLIEDGVVSENFIADLSPRVRSGKHGCCTVQTASEGGEAACWEALSALEVQVRAAALRVDSLMNREEACYLLATLQVVIPQDVQVVLYTALQNEDLAELAADYGVMVLINDFSDHDIEWLS